MPQILYDAQGRPTNFDNLSDAKAALLAKTHTARDGSDRINVTTLDGTTTAVPVGDLEHQPTSSPLTPEGTSESAARHTEQIHENTYGGVGRALETTGKAALRSATFGLANKALESVGILDGHEERMLVERHSIAAGIGTGIGLVMPGGAASLAGKAAKLVTGAGLVSRVGAGVVEGAVLGAADAAANVALSDKEYFSEALLSNVGTGMLWGGAAGGAISGTLKGLGNLKNYSQRNALKVATAGSEEGIAIKGIVNGHIDDIGQQLDDAGMSLRDAKLARDGAVGKGTPGQGRKDLFELNPVLDEGAASPLAFKGGSPASRGKPGSTEVMSAEELAARDLGDELVGARTGPGTSRVESVVTGGRPRGTAVMPRGPNNTVVDSADELAARGFRDDLVGARTGPVTSRMSAVAPGGRPRDTAMIPRGPGNTVVDSAEELAARGFRDDLVGARTGPVTSRMGAVDDVPFDTAKMLEELRAAPTENVGKVGTTAATVNVGKAGTTAATLKEAEKVPGRIASKLEQAMDRHAAAAKVFKKEIHLPELDAQVGLLGPKYIGRAVAALDDMKASADEIMALAGAPARDVAHVINPNKSIQSALGAEMPVDIESLARAAGFKGDMPQSHAAMALLGHWAVAQTTKPGGIVPGIMKRAVVGVAGGAVAAALGVPAGIAGMLGAGSALGGAGLIGRIIGTAGLSQKILDKSIKAFLAGATHPGVAKAAIPAAIGFLRTARYYADAPGSPKTKGGGKGQTAAEAMAQRVGELAKAVANEPATLRIIQDSMDPITSVDPRLSEELIIRGTTMLRYLHTKAPRLPPAPIVGVNRYQFSDHEINKFARIARAAASPQHVVDAIARGVATKDEIDTLVALWPATYKKIQSRIIQSLGDFKDATYGRRVQLSLMMGVPLDETLKPEFVTSMQQNWAEREGGATGEEQPGTSPGSYGKISAEQPTSAQRSLERKPVKAA